MFSIRKYSVLNQVNTYSTIFLIIVVAGIFVDHIDMPIRIWDEAVYANNSIDMAESGNLFILKNSGQPSFFNTKPPFVIWIQSIFIVFFGITEFSIRIPSYLALLAIGLAGISFLKRHHQGLITQMLFVIVLLSSPGFISPHVALTGDLDIILTLWMFCLGLVVFDNYLDPANDKINRRIWLSGLFFFLGFLTKSWAMVLVLPGFIFIVLLSNNWKKILFNYHFPIAVFVVAALITLYYVYLNLINPGYFDIVMSSEIKRFFYNVMPWHSQPFNYYFKNFSNRFFPWYVILLFSITTYPFLKGYHTKRIFVACLIGSIFYLLLISIPQVKLEWYDAPLYPFFALMIAITFGNLVVYLRPILGKVLNVIFLSTIFIAGVFLIISSSQKVRNYQPDILEREGSFLKAVHSKIATNAKVLMKVEHVEHRNQVLFYIKKYQKENSLNISIHGNITEVVTGDSIISCQMDQKALLNSFFITDTITTIGDCYLIKLVSRKN